MTKKEHIVRSRNREKSETIIEDLKMLVCTVCGHTELTESSQMYVDYIREKFRKEMKIHSLNKEQVNEPIYKDMKKEKTNISFLKDTIRKWIG